MIPEYEGIENWQINRALASVLGYKIVKMDEPEILDWFEPTLGSQQHYELWYYAELLGKRISDNKPSEELADEHAEIPNYVEDANEALSLTVDGWTLEVRNINHHIFGKWFAQYYNDNNINVAKGYADTPAEAICRARLSLVNHFEWVKSLP